MNTLIVAKWLIQLESRLPFAVLIDRELGSWNELSVLVDPQSRTRRRASLLLTSIWSMPARPSEPMTICPSACGASKPGESGYEVVPEPKLASSDWSSVSCEFWLRELILQLESPESGGDQGDQAAERRAPKPASWSAIRAMLETRLLPTTELCEPACARLDAAELGSVGVRHASTPCMGRTMRGRSLRVRYAGEERHLAVDRRLLHGNEEGKHAGGALCVGERNFARRTGSHVRVDGGGLVGLQRAKDVAGDEIVDMPDVIRN